MGRSGPSQLDQADLSEMPPPARLPRSGALVSVREERLVRRGVAYTVYPVGNGIGYAPGLDLYATVTPRGRLHLLSLYEDQEAERED